jgi:hypothetical protein
MPRYTCQFCCGTSRTPLQESPIDSTLKLCTTCVRYQRRSVYTKTEEIETSRVKQNSNSSDEENNTKRVQISVKKEAKSSMNSPKIKKEKGGNKILADSLLPASELPQVVLKKKKKKKQNSSVEKKPGSGSLGSVLKKKNRKRKFDHEKKNPIFKKKRKTIELSSIFLRIKNT